jgi:undecaprenyl-diphosphatase
MPIDAATTALVQSLGARALPLYLALLLLVLATVTALWWLARRSTLPRLINPRPPGATLLMRLAVGFAVVVAGAAVFAELAEALGDGPRVGALDQMFSAAVLQAINPGVQRFFGALTHLGDTTTLVGLGGLVVALLWWRQRRWLALAWVLAVAGNGLLNVTLKRIFARTRPVHDDLLFSAQGFSFPSGHSSGAVVAYGMLAYVLLQSLDPGPARRASLPVLLAAAALAFSIGCSRVFIGVHYATDVLAGFASGSAWLAVCLASVALTRHYQRPVT